MSVRPLPHMFVVKDLIPVSITIMTPLYRSPTYDNTNDVRISRIGHEQLLRPIQFH